jgi:tetratricopeptide (TPR) repeat protein
MARRKPKRKQYVAKRPAAKRSAAKPVKKPAPKRNFLDEARAAFKEEAIDLGCVLLRKAGAAARSAPRRAAIQQMWHRQANRLRATDVEASLPLYEAGIALYREGDDTLLTADMLNEFGWYAHSVGRLDDGERACRRALAMHEAADRADRAGWAVGNLSSILFTRGDLAGAEQLARDSIAKAIEAGDHYARPNLMYGLAIVLHEQGRELEAGQVAEEAEPLAREAQRNDTLGNILNLRANLALDDSQLDEATTHYLAARALFKRTGQKGSDAITVSNLGIVAWEAEELDEAISKFDSAVRALTKLGDNRSLAIALTDRGQVRTELGQFDAAHRDLVRALALTIEVGHHRRQAHVRCAFARLAETRDQLDEARAHFGEAEITFDSTGGATDTRSVASMLYALAGVQAEAGDPEGAAAIAARATATFPWAEGTPRPGDAATRALRELAAARIDAARARHTDFETARTLRERAAACLAAIEGAEDPLTARCAEVRRVAGRLRASLARGSA